MSKRLVALLALLAGGCASDQQMTAPVANNPTAAPSAATGMTPATQQAVKAAQDKASQDTITQAGGTSGIDEYVLGAGDKVKITVFGEEELSGEYKLDSVGSVSMPLIGSIKANGLSERQLEERIGASLSQGYLLNPKISVEVLNYRPFFILGEVNQPGSFEYESGMNILKAVAKANGFTYRARTEYVLLTRARDPQKREIEATVDTLVMPGDIIKVKERLF